MIIPRMSNARRGVGHVGHANAYLEQEEQRKKSTEKYLTGRGSTLSEHIQTAVHVRRGNDFHWPEYMQNFVYKGGTTRRFSESWIRSVCAVAAELRPLRSVMQSVETRHSGGEITDFWLLRPLRHWHDTRVSSCSLHVTSCHVTSRLTSVQHRKGV